jgi:hypothetical protein
LYKAKWLDGKPCCPLCQFALHDVNGETQELSAEVVKVQERIWQIMDDGYVVMGGIPAYSHLYFQVVHQLLKLMMTRRYGPKFREAVGLKQDITKGHKMFESVPIKDQAEMQVKVLWLLDDWPSRFVIICEQHKLLSSALLRDMDPAPFWYWRVVNEYLYRPDRFVTEVEIREAIKYMEDRGMPYS